MLRTGEIVQGDELGEGSSESIVVRLSGSDNVRHRPTGKRDLLEIPPSELLAVLSPFLPTRDPDRRRFSNNREAELSEEELFRKILDHYGFTRLTKARRDYLAKAHPRSEVGALTAAAPLSGWLAELWAASRVSSVRA
jgi:hypothetical protein